MEQFIPIILTIGVTLYFPLIHPHSLTLNWEGHVNVRQGVCHKGRKERENIFKSIRLCFIPRTITYVRAPGTYSTHCSILSCMLDCSLPLSKRAEF